MSIKAKKKANQRKKHMPPTRKVIEAARKTNMGNSFWMLRSKHGRDKLFASPKLLEEAAAEYFKYCDENPLKTKKTKIGDVVETQSEVLRRPYSLQGLCRYLGTHDAYFRQFKQSEAYKNDEDFSTVIKSIETTIFEQQFEGAAVGQFNANIISRTLGLAEKIDHSNDGEKFEAPIINNYNTAPPLAGAEDEIADRK